MQTDGSHSTARGGYASSQTAWGNPKGCCSSSTAHASRPTPRGRSGRRGTASGGTTSPPSVARHRPRLRWSRPDGRPPPCCSSAQRRSAWTPLPPVWAGTASAPTRGHKTTRRQPPRRRRPVEPTETGPPTGAVRPSRFGCTRCTKIGGSALRTRPGGVRESLIWATPRGGCTYRAFLASRHLARGRLGVSGMAKRGQPSL
mmetsp:Transcript_20359/g.66034  ORF Transcript_20359/g.66034 Transcript_20359/m.66034 type:complete len:201 (-) Transcript_20359:531-1133(-)